MHDKARFLALLEKYTRDQLSSSEHNAFMALVTSGLYNDMIKEHIENKLYSSKNEGASLPPNRSADILNNIIFSEKQNALLMPKKTAKAKIMRWAVAAAITVAVFISGYLITEHNNTDISISAVFTHPMVERFNGSRAPMPIRLEDGSLISLQPGSLIHYPTHFLQNKREIFLEGDAFFQVSKDPGRPFFVYNANVVTRVLGTSFNVKVNKATKEIEVAVRSGRVEVYENSMSGKAPENKRNNGVVLLPNQKVVYEQQTRQFIPSLVDMPVPVTHEGTDTGAVAESFIFQATSLKTVLGSIEKTYGLDIIVENDKIYQCLFTGDLSMQDLYSRLNIICQSVQASYEVKGTKILIRGKGC